MADDTVIKIDIEGQSAVAGPDRAKQTTTPKPRPLPADVAAAEAEEKRQKTRKQTSKANAPENANNLFAQFASAAGDKTDPKKLATVAAFASNLGTLQGRNTGSARAARSLVDGRHSSSAAVLNSYAVAGKEITPEMREIIDELDNLAHHGNSIAGMDDRVRMGWTGKGAATYDIGALERREGELTKQLADMARGVMTEDERLNLRGKRADVSVKEHNAATLAAGIDPKTKGEWDDQLRQMTPQEIGERIEENNLNGIARNYALAYQQKLIQDQAATETNKLKGGTAVDSYRASNIASNYSDPSILAGQIEEHNRQNQLLIEEGLPPKREIDLGEGIGVVSNGDAVRALGMLSALTDEGKLVGQGKDPDALSPAQQEFLRGVHSNSQNQVNSYYNTLNELGADTSSESVLTQPVQAAQLELTEALLAGDAKRAAQANSKITQAIQASQDLFVKYAEPELREAYQSLFQVRKFRTVDQAQNYLIFASPDQKSVEATGSYKEVLGVVNALEAHEFSTNAEVYAGLDPTSTPKAGDETHPLSNMFANDPTARASANQAWTGQVNSDFVQTGLRAFYANLAQEITARTDLQDGEKAQMLGEIQAMQDEIFDPRTGDLNGSSGRGLIGRAEFRVSDPDDPENVEGVVLKDENGDPVLIRQVNLEALINLSSAHQVILEGFGMGADKSNPMNFVFQNKEAFVDQVAANHIPKSATDKALFSVINESYARNLGDPKGLAIVKANVLFGAEAMQERVNAAFTNEEFEVVDTVTKLAITQGFDKSEIYFKAVDKYRAAATEQLFNSQGTPADTEEYERRTFETPSVETLIEEGFVSRLDLENYTKTGQ